MMERLISKTDQTATRVAGLAERIRGLEAAFSCGGAITLTEPLTLQFGDRRRMRVQPEDMWTRTLGKKLMAECGPAPFGVGSKTVRDRRVRDGRQLLAKGGALRVSGLDLVETGILDEIRGALCPEDAAVPVAELHALNVYGPGGRFVTHKDTPRDVGVFGTLVVCLPIWFRGGALVLRHGSTRRFAWETVEPFVPRKRDEAYTVRWAAFYGDVDHEIEPIGEGHRVTLTWLLRRGAAGQPLLRRPTASIRDLEADLAAALADRRFLPSGGILGVPCAHLYAAASGRSPFAEALSEGGTSSLKGRDRLVAAAALGAGLSVRVRPYLFETSGDEAWRLKRPPTDRERGRFRRRRLDAVDIEEILPVERHADWDEEDDVTWVTAPPWIRGWTRAERSDRLQDAEPASDFLSEVEYSPTGYFGNEGGYAAFYVSAALLIETPPARKRTVRKRRPG